MRVCVCVYERNICIYVYTHTCTHTPGRECPWEKNFIITWLGADIYVLLTSCLLSNRNISLNLRYHALWLQVISMRDHKWPRSREQDSISDLVASVSQKPLRTDETICEQGSNLNGLMINFKGKLLKLGMCTPQHIYTWWKELQITQLFGKINQFMKLRGELVIWRILPLMKWRYNNSSIDVGFEGRI